MASKSVNSDDKIMDVSKPGSGKISSGSRPVITGSKSNAKDNIMKTEDASKLTEGIKAPSATRRVIQPLSNDIKPEESTTTNIQVVSDSSGDGNISDSIKSNVEASDEAVDPQEKPVKVAITDANEEPDSSDQAEESDQDANKPEQANSESPDIDDSNKASSEAPKSDTDTTPEPEPTTDGSADSAGVDELAKKAEDKKLAAKKAEEEKLRFAEIDELAASKKYHVKISHSHDLGSVGSGSKKHLVVMLLLLLMALIAGYLIVDAKVVDNNISLPYEVFKEEAPAETQSTETTEDTQTTEDNEESELDEPSQRDENRKTEIKNLQQNLEAFFADFDSYPATLADLTPKLTTDEITGPDDVAYVYNSAPETCETSEGDCTSYTLSTKLENADDPDAGDNGNYVVQSVN